MNTASRNDPVFADSRGEAFPGQAKSCAAGNLLTRTDCGTNNGWNNQAKMHANSRTILDLLLRIITISQKTKPLVISFPKPTSK